MNARELLFLGIALSITGASAQEGKQNPGSLWSNKAPDRYRDSVARKAGDVITILINEVSTSTFSASTQASKSDSTNIAKGLGPLLANLIPQWGIGADSKNSGKGSTNQAGNLSARMSAVVKEVSANGTMTIEGVRSITTNKETQTFTLSGIIRPEDVRSDNTVLSQNLANATIKVEGKGMIADRTRKGILTRILDWLF
ncbi:MAG: flagellar basal body L-ring protein FlgH [Fimbriimonadaceae bacterium]